MDLICKSCAAGYCERGCREWDGIPLGRTDEIVAWQKKMADTRQATDYYGKPETCGKCGGAMVNWGS